MMNSNYPCRLKQNRRHSCLPLIAVIAVSGCAEGPSPVVIHESPHVTVRVQYDPHAGSGHAHPASLTSEQLINVLSGVRVSKRDPFGTGGLLFQSTEAVPAFSPSEIAVLAPYLAQALRKASSRDLATFYSITTDRERGERITSGGLFVRTGRLYIILANFHTPPSAGPFEGVAYELDYRDEPLQPIARYRFTVGFSPADAWIPNSQAREAGGYAGYIDEAKQLVIDLPRLMPGTGAAITK